MVMPNESVSTNDLPSAFGEKVHEQETDMCENNFRFGFINHGGRSSTPNRGLPSKNRPVQSPPPFLFHQCYELGHISPKCSLTDFDVEKIIINYEGLSPSHTTLVPATSYLVTQLAISPRIASTRNRGKKKQP